MVEEILFQMSSLLNVFNEIIYVKVMCAREYFQKKFLCCVSSG